MRRCDFRGAGLRLASLGISAVPCRDYLWSWIAKQRPMTSSMLSPRRDNLEPIAFSMKNTPDLVSCLSWGVSQQEKPSHPSGWYHETQAGEWQPTAAGEENMTACDGFLKVSGTIIISAP